MAIWEENDLFVNFLKRKDCIVVDINYN